MFSPSTCSFIHVIKIGFQMFRNWVDGVNVLITDMTLGG